MVEILFLLAPGGFKAFSDARSASKSSIVGAAILAIGLSATVPLCESVLSMPTALLRTDLGIDQPTRVTNGFQAVVSVIYRTNWQSRAKGHSQLRLVKGDKKASNTSEDSRQLRSLEVVARALFSVREVTTV